MTKEKEIELFQQGYEQAKQDLRLEIAEEKAKIWTGGFDDGYARAKKNLGWHSVDESLPPMDEEVIVLRDTRNGVFLGAGYYISFGHIVDKEEAEDWNGWNVEGVKYWMPMPEIDNEK